MSANIGAKDRLDKALVRQYAATQTTRMEDINVLSSEEIWEKMRLIGLDHQTQFNLKHNLQKVS